MAGIIGSMLAGAAESFGSGMGKLGSASILEDQKAQIEAERDKRLQEFTTKRDESLHQNALSIEGVRQAGESERLETREKGSDRRLDKKEAGDTARQKDEFAFRSTENAATRAQALELAQMTNNRIIEEGKLNRGQQAQQHSERMAQAKEAFKNQGLSIVSAKEGMQIVDAKTGKATLITGSDGKPIHQLKEDDSFKLLTALTNMAKAAGETGDAVAAKRYNDMAESILTRGTAGKGGSTFKDPFKSGATEQPKPKVATTDKSSIIGSGMQSPERPAAKSEPKPQNENTKAYESAMRNSFLTKVAERIGAGTVDFATAVGKLGWDWDHFHKTGELKRKFATQGMTPVGNSLE